MTRGKNLEGTPLPCLRPACCALWAIFDVLPLPNLSHRSPEARRRLHHAGAAKRVVGPPIQNPKSKICPILLIDSLPLTLRAASNSLGIGPIHANSHCTSVAHS